MLLSLHAWNAIKEININVNNNALINRINLLLPVIYENIIKLFMQIMSLFVNNCFQFSAIFISYLFSRPITEGMENCAFFILLSSGSIE